MAVSCWNVTQGTAEDTGSTTCVSMLFSLLDSVGANSVSAKKKQNNFVEMETHSLEIFGIFLNHVFCFLPCFVFLKAADMQQRTRQRGRKSRRTCCFDVLTETFATTTFLNAKQDQHKKSAMQTKKGPCQRMEQSSELKENMELKAWILLGLYTQNQHDTA